MYSFGLQLWGIVVAQNLSALWFFCFNELKILFNFNTEMRGIRMATVSIIGIIFILSIAYYFLS